MPIAMMIPSCDEGFCRPITGSRNGGPKMTQLRSLTVLSIVFASILSAAAQSTAQKRDVVLDLSLPNGATPQLRISEGGTGTVELPDIGKFGFVPTIQESNPEV